jgi:predicted RNA-binding Zn-ribbon protein involved in translation (DUF1610 family)
MRIECPHCNKTLQAPDQKAGQVVNCPSCGGQMQLPAAGAAPPPPQSPTPQSPAPSTGGGMGAGAPPQHIGVQPMAPSTSKATKSCPYCGEEIMAVAQKCKHCGTFLTGPMRGSSRAAGARGRRAASSGGMGDGTKAIIFGVIGLLFCNIIFGPLAIVYGNKARQAGETGTGTAGIVLGIIDLVIFVLVLIANIAARS